MLRLRLGALTFIALAPVQAAGSASRQTNNFYHGKPLTIGVGFTAGGGFDATTTDPAFLAAAKRERLPVYSKNAKEALEVANSINSAPEAIVRAARKIATE